MHYMIYVLLNKSPRRQSLFSSECESVSMSVCHVFGTPFKLLQIFVAIYKSEILDVIRYSWYLYCFFFM